MKGFAIVRLGFTVMDDEHWRVSSSDGVSGPAVGEVELRQLSTFIGIQS